MKIPDSSHESVASPLWLHVGWVWWCVPALLLALALRLILLAAWPHALFWPDSDDSLATATYWVDEGLWKMHTKKTWLSPVIYTGLGYLPGGIMRWAAVTQHALGLLCVLLAGGLCREWLKHWRIAIIPVTLLIAAHPTLMVWEHSIMQESWFVTALLAVAWCAARYVRQATWAHFAWLALSLFICAGARPEGKLLAPVGFLAAGFALWKQWKPLILALVLLAALAWSIKKSTVTGQAGLLLLTSVVKFMPDDLPGQPGLADKLRPIRDQLTSPANAFTQFPKARTRSKIASAIDDWIHEQQSDARKKKNKRQVDQVCLETAKSICLRRATALPGWVWDKFRLVAGRQTSPEWTAKSVVDEQVDAFKGDTHIAWRLGARLFGRGAPGYETAAEWVHRQAPAPSPRYWLHRWEEWWQGHPLAWRVPASVPAGELPGVPWFKLLAGVGMVTGLLGTGTRQRAQWAFLPVLAGLAFVVLLTCNIKARFLFFLDPFWLLYLAVLADALARGWQWLRARRPAPSAS